MTRQNFLFCSHIKAFIKSLAAFLVVSFLSQNLVLANQEFFSSPSQTSQAKSAVNFELPESIASIEDTYKAPNASKTIYLLQDAHTNTSGQINLAKTLDILLKNNQDLKHVFLEAGSGNETLSPLRKYLSLEERQRIGKSLIHQAKLQGSEYLDLTSGYNFTLYGVENPSLYTQALENYKQVTKNRPQYQDYLNKIDQTIKILKPRIYNPLLLSLDESRFQYQKGSITITRYLEKLSLHQTLENYPHLKDLKRLQRLEQVLENQKRHYPKLSIINHYKKLSSNLQAQQILKELEDLENQTFESLTATKDERTLLNASKLTNHFQKLLSLTLTPEEYRDYLKLRQGSGIKELTGFLNKKIMDLKAFYENALFLEEGFEDVIKCSEEFYDLTLKRDQAFMENLTKVWSTPSAALIAGGYHTPNLKKLLKEKNISYVVLTPAITHETNQKRYEQLLLNQKPFNSKVPVLFAGQASHTLGVPQTGLPEIIGLLPANDQEPARRAVLGARMAEERDLETGVAKLLRHEAAPFLNTLINVGIFKDKAKGMALKKYADLEILIKFYNPNNSEKFYRVSDDPHLSIARAETKGLVNLDKDFLKNEPIDKNKLLIFKTIHETLNPALAQLAKHVNAGDLEKIKATAMNISQLVDKIVADAQGARLGDKSEDPLLRLRRFSVKAVSKSQTKTTISRSKYGQLSFKPFKSSSEVSDNFMHTLNLIKKEKNDPQAGQEAAFSFLRRLPQGGNKARLILDLAYAVNEKFGVESSKEFDFFRQASSFSPETLKNGLHKKEEIEELSRRNDFVNLMRSHLYNIRYGSNSEESNKTPEGARLANVEKILNGFIEESLQISERQNQGEADLREKALLFFKNMEFPETGSEIKSLISDIFKLAEKLEKMDNLQLAVSVFRKVLFNQTARLMVRGNGNEEEGKARRFIFGLLEKKKQSLPARTTTTAVEGARLAFDFEGRFNEEDFEFIRSEEDRELFKKVFFKWVPSLYVNPKIQLNLPLFENRIKKSMELAQKDAEEEKERGGSPVQNLRTASILKLKGTAHQLKQMIDEGKSDKVLSEALSAALKEAAWLRRRSKEVPVDQAVRDSDELEKILKDQSVYVIGLLRKLYQENDGARLSVKDEIISVSEKLKKEKDPEEISKILQTLTSKTGFLLKKSSDEEAESYRKAIKNSHELNEVFEEILIQNPGKGRIRFYIKRLKSGQNPDEYLDNALSGTVDRIIERDTAESRLEEKFGPNESSQDVMGELWALQQDSPNPSKLLERILRAGKKLIFLGYNRVDIDSFDGMKEKVEEDIRFISSQNLLTDVVLISEGALNNLSFENAGNVKVHPLDSRGDVLTSLVETIENLLKENPKAKILVLGPWTHFQKSHLARVRNKRDVIKSVSAVLLERQSVKPGETASVFDTTVNLLGDMESGDNQPRKALQVFLDRYGIREHFALGREAFGYLENISISPHYPHFLKDGWDGIIIRPPASEKFAARLAMEYFALEAIYSHPNEVTARRGSGVEYKDLALSRNRERTDILKPSVEKGVVKIEIEDEPVWSIPHPEQRLAELRRKYSAETREALSAQGYLGLVRLEGSSSQNALTEIPENAVAWRGALDLAELANIRDLSQFQAQVTLLAAQILDFKNGGAGKNFEVVYFDFGVGLTDAQTQIVRQLSMDARFIKLGAPQGDFDGITFYFSGASKETKTANLKRSLHLFIENLGDSAAILAPVLVQAQATVGWVGERSLEELKTEAYDPALQKIVSFHNRHTVSADLDGEGYIQILTNQANLQFIAEHAFQLPRITEKINQAARLAQAVWRSVHGSA